MKPKEVKWFTNEPSIAAKRRRQVYSSKRWKYISMQYRLSHPMCEYCLYYEDLDEAKPTEDVHHIVPLEQSLALAYEECNLIALCKHHHGLVHTNQLSVNKLIDVKNGEKGTSMQDNREGSGDFSF